MSTYANGMQQTYQEIWASMERSCVGLTAALRSASPDNVEAAAAGMEWPDMAAGAHHRKHPLRTPRRSARGRRRIAARTR